MKKGTILLVDDDPGVLEGLSRVLRTEGWRVFAAASGEKALERLAEIQPDLVITDLKMGQVSGWDLLFHERIQRPDLPIFVITALPLSAVEGVAVVADGVFQKPLNLDALLKAIRDQLSATAGNNEN